MIDFEALRAIFATHLIQERRYRNIDPIGIPIVSKYLESRTLADAAKNNAFTAEIRNTTDALMEEEEDESSGLVWRKHIHALCCAATKTMGCSLVIEHLNDGLTNNVVTGQGSQNVLAAAAYTGRLARVQSMIEEGSDTNATSDYFGTPLQAAASGGHMDSVLLLLENEADAMTSLVPASSTSRYSSAYENIVTALRAASTAGHEDIVRLLSNSKYEFEDSHRIFQFAACDAAQMGHASIVRFLLDRIETARRPRLQELILLTVSEHGHEIIAQWMLDLGTNIHAGLGNRDPPIQRAVAGGHYRIVQLLLAGGASQVEGRHGTLLHQAAWRGFVKVAQVLIDHGADIDACRPTPIAVAASCGHVDMVQFLIEKGANLPLEASGHMALRCAARNGHELIIRLLVGGGVDVDGTDEEFNPLLNAILEGHDQVAKTLVELGAERKDPSQNKFAKEHAKFLARGSYGKGHRLKAKISYDEHMLAFQRLDKSLFPPE